MIVTRCWPDAVEQALDVILHQPLGVLARGQVGGLEDLLGGLGADTTELVFHERAQVAALGLLEHPREDAQLYTIGMRLDLDRVGRQFLRGVGVDDRFALGVAIGQVQW